MENEEKQDDKGAAGEMNKRRETMADGRRYIIFYTFGDEGKQKSETGGGEVKKNV